MPKLTRYLVECDAFTGRSAPYTATASYFTNAPFDRREADYRNIAGDDVLGEF